MDHRYSLIGEKALKALFHGRRCRSGRYPPKRAVTWEPLVIMKILWLRKNKTTPADGEGGATLVLSSVNQTSRIIVKGHPNRGQFFRGQVGNAARRDIGSSYLMSDRGCIPVGAAERRISIQPAASGALRSQNYYDALAPLKAGRIELPSIR